MVISLLAFLGADHDKKRKITLKSFRENNEKLSNSVILTINQGHYK